MDIDKRYRRYSLIFRAHEFIGCSMCLILAIVLIYYQIYYHQETDPTLTYPTLFVLFTPCIIFTMVTVYDLVYYFREQPIYSHTTWWPFAILASILFFMATGFIAYKMKEFENVKISLILAFTTITGVIFLLDILVMLFRCYRKFRNFDPQEDIRNREYYDTRFKPTVVVPSRSVRTMQRSPEFETCPPCTYLCEKTTSYHNVPVKMKSSAMIQHRESRRALGDERIIYPSIHVTQPAGTEEKYTQSSRTSVCKCETKGGNCQQCKWIKYLLKAQQRSEKMTRERRGSKGPPTKYAPYESESSSPVSSGNQPKPVVYQEQLTVKKPSKKVSSQYKEYQSINEVENKQSIHNLQNTEIIKTFIQQQNISPRISKKEVSWHTSIRSTRKPSYNQKTSVIIHQEPSTIKENKYTQSNLICDSKDQQTNTSRHNLQKSRPRRTSSQEEVALQVIDYEQTRLQNISEVSLEHVTKSDAYNTGIPKIYVSDNADSDNSKRIPSSLSSQAPCKRTQYANDTKCACAHKSALDDAICVHCLQQWRKYQSTKSSDNEPSPPNINEKRNGLDPQPSFRERVSQGLQIRQASALFQYISTKSNTSPSTSHLNSLMCVQPQQPISRRLYAPCRNSARSEPPKVLCMCKENEDPGCKMHGTKNKLISLPSSASRRQNVPKINHSTQIGRKDRYKTSP